METPFWRHIDAGDGLHVAFSSVRAGNLSLNAGVRGAGDQHAARRQVLGNRRALEAQMGIAPQSLRFLHQVHSADVLDVADVADRTLSTVEEEPPVGDAWISADAGTPLAIMVADCLPVMFVGRAEDGAALSAGAHAGRVGLLTGVLENTVAALRRAGAAQISAWIGPAACGSCYEVPEAMRQESSRHRPALVSETSWGTPALNLRGEAAAVLRTQGVEVHDLGGCTIEDDSLFSHRRAPEQGRFAGLVWRA